MPHFVATNSSQFATTRYERSRINGVERSVSFINVNRLLINQLNKRSTGFTYPKHLKTRLFNPLVTNPTAANPSPPIHLHLNDNGAL